MITILIVGDNITDNERIAGSIIGGTELSTCVLCTRSADEALKIAESRQYTIDLFIIHVRMKEQSGYLLSEKIRKLPKYRECPVIFVTSLSYNASGFPDLATYQSYRKFNYISLPVKRIDVQGKLGLYLDEILASQALRDKADRAIFLNHAKGEAIISVREILYAEVQGKTCRVYTAEDVFEIKRKNLAEIIDAVDDNAFLRCHRGFALNIKQLKGIEKVDRRIWKAIFQKENGTCLISKSYFESIMKAYKNCGGDPI